jgi:prepilin-type N-terminal cleavage/methylation domain-containing protein
LQAAFQEKNLKEIKFLNTKGFTLVEMMIATAIMSVVVLGGFQAYSYFNDQTIKEAKKMDDISEFNALTKDLVNFTEGAGISTFFLNQPIKSSNCNETEPCVRQLNDQTFKAPTGSLPGALNGNTCVQFYKDAKGKIDSKLAFIGKPSADKVWAPSDLELTASKELYATWIIKDESSPPFLMMKSRDASIFLKYLVGEITVSRVKESTYQGMSHAFFESDTAVDVLNKLKGYPFLIYNSLYSNQYTIRYAHEIVSCKERRADCIALMQILYPTPLPTSDAALSIHSGGNFPDKVFAINFKEIDFQNSFFKRIFDRQQLPTSCLSSWGNGVQPASGQYFPSKVLSVSPDPDEIDSEIDVNPVNILYLGKYIYKKTLKSPTKGVYVALPIDIITLRAEQSEVPGIHQLVSELWHHHEIKKKIKIHKLQTPFTISRKLGSAEMGIWYNPIKKKDVSK